MPTIGAFYFCFFFVFLDLKNDYVTCMNYHRVDQKGSNIFGVFLV